MSWTHRLAALEPSPSFATVTPINTTTSNSSSRSSLLEHHLAKYRSLPFLWLRACTTSNQQNRRRTFTGNSGDGKYTTIGDLGEFENRCDLFLRYLLLFIAVSLFHIKQNAESYL